jgi:hypothetical protein
MSEYSVTCACGNRMHITEAEIGMEALCPACSQPLVMTPDGAHSVAPEPVVTQPAPEPTPRTTARTCARCGRTFRGDWDRNETHRGYLCTICTNLATDPAAPIQSEEGLAAIRPVETAKIEAEREYETAAVHARRLAASEQEEREKRRFDPQAPWFQRTLQVLAALIVLLAVFFFLTEGMEVESPPRGVPGERVEVEPVELSGFTLAASHVISIIFNTLGMLLPLYFALKITDKLPYDVLLFDLLHVTVVSFVIAFLTLVISMVPILGFILSIIITIYVLFEVYDVGFTGFLYYCLLHIPVRILLYLLKLMLLGLIVNVVG